MTSPRKPNRREFLRGTAAADALADAADRVLGELDSSADGQPPPAAENYLVQLSRRAMACQFQIYFNAGQYEQATEVALAALDLVERLEDQMTVYREHSEVSQINRHAATEPVAVEPRLYALLKQAVRLWEETNGAYDVTSGPLSQVWGFTRRAGAIPAPDIVAAALARVGSGQLIFDDEQLTVEFPGPGVELNLGSIGKGYALDRCAELFAENEIHDYLLHGGNSSVLGRGSHGVTPGQGWSVGVRNPLRPDKRLGEIHLRDRALATSGSGTQFFIHEGQRYGHILDPRTGWPAQQVLSATVIAPTAALADALSTAFYVLGPEGAGSYCKDHPTIAAVLLCSGTRSGGLEVYTFGLEQNELTGESYSWS